VSHADPVTLALQALGGSAGGPPGDDHVRTCPQCRVELARLTQVVEVARQAGPARLDQPPPQVWDRIAAAVTTSEAANPEAANPEAANPEAPVSNGQAASAPSRDARPQPRHPRQPRGRRRPIRTLATLAAGLVIGIGATLGIVNLTSSPSPRVIAQIELNPLPQFPQWQGAAGTAVMQATASQPVISVSLRAPERPGFYEVWLLARNGVSMISLGDLNASHTGTFTVPPGTDLRNYSRIDVSLQPFNGSTVHTKDSVVRGTLPPVAYGAG
jgi:hypothetical protein